MSLKWPNATSCLQSLGPHIVNVTRSMGQMRLGSSPVDWTSSRVRRVTFPSVRRLSALQLFTDAVPTPVTNLHPVSVLASVSAMIQSLWSVSSNRRRIWRLLRFQGSSRGLSCRATPVPLPPEPVPRPNDVYLKLLVQLTSVVFCLAR